MFSDQLNYWCNQPIDYIGAPWFEGFSKPQSEQLVGVGNSGFCLRRVETFQRVIKEYNLVKRMKDVSRKIISDCVHLRFRQLSNDWTNGRGKKLFGPEDVFWGIQVPRLFPWFRVPSPEVALAFSFEVQPEVLFKKNQNKLPFGCHAWDLYNPSFWKPFLEAEGYRV